MSYTRQQRYPIPRRAETSNDAAVKTSNTAPAETSSDEDAGEWKDKTETVYVDANADGSVKKITVKDWLRRNGDGEIIDFPI